MRQSGEGRRSVEHSYAPKSKLQALLPRPPLQEVPVYEDSHSSVPEPEVRTNYRQTSQIPPPVPTHDSIHAQQPVIPPPISHHDNSYMQSAAVPPPVPAHRTLDSPRRSSIPRKPVGDEQMTTVHTEGAYSGGVSGRDRMDEDPYQVSGLAPGAVQSRRPKQRTIGEQPYVVKSALEPPSLEGIVDLTNTVDTTISEQYAPGKPWK